MGDIKELTIYDFEELWYAATELVYQILMEGMMLDEDGNYAGYDEKRSVAWIETRNTDLRFKYLNFRECEELKQFTLADVCDLSASKILEKYLSATLPIYHKAMRSGTHLLIGYRVSNDIPDTYLDQLFAMAWKADLKMWALQWDKEKATRKEDATNE